MRKSLEDEDYEGPYHRASLIVWHAILNDPELSHLKEELFEEGRLSGKSYLELFTKLSLLSHSQVEPYIESITPDSPDIISEQMNIIGAILMRRVWYDIYPAPDPRYIAMLRKTVLLP